MSKKTERCGWCNNGKVVSDDISSKKKKNCPFCNRNGLRGYRKPIVKTVDEPSLDPSFDELTKDN